MAEPFLGQIVTFGFGWAPIGSQINDSTVPYTNPEWKEAWKGSRIVSHRRFGRTGWNVSDIVLGWIYCVVVFVLTERGIAALGRRAARGLRGLELACFG